MIEDIGLNYFVVFDKVNMLINNAMGRPVQSRERNLIKERSDPQIFNKMRVFVFKK